MTFFIPHATACMGHDMRYVIDSTKINKLGLIPQTDFADGIEKTFKWYSGNRDRQKDFVNEEYRSSYERMYSETDKPQISILMAVYEPRMDWLKEQLDSLNSQTYPNLKLYILDDASPSVSLSELEALVSKCITAFPFTIQRNEKNLGSNATFERLTKEAEGDCFAYCDQDDVWLPEKLSVLQNALEEQEALLVCSDMFIIDREGNRTADTITKIRRHHVFRSGVGLAEGLLFRNFVTGCTMLVDASAAKAAIPFCPYMVHDHYLALWCASQGRIYSENQPLINYRIHGGNQTGIMNGVHDKESYRAVRIDLILNRLLWLSKVPQICHAVGEELDNGIRWAKARQAHFQGKPGTFRQMWKYRYFGPPTVLFETVAAKLPERLFLAIIDLNRNNIL